MADIEVIDAHVHAFENDDRGILYQRGNGGERELKRTGSLEELEKLMKEAGISHSIMLMYTPTRYMYEARIRQQELPADPAERRAIEQEVRTMMAQRMIENNEWGIKVSQQHPEFVTFAGLDPVYMDEETLVGEMGFLWLVIL